MICYVQDPHSHLMNLWHKILDKINPIIQSGMIYVTGFGKTLRMGFFQKIEFDAWLISSTIELTRVQVLGRSRASLWRYSALFVIAPHPQ